MGVRGIVGVASAIGSILGFLLTVGGVVLLGYVYSEARGGGLGALVIFLIYLVITLGMFIVGNIVFIVSSLRGGTVARILSAPMALVDGLAALVVALASLEAFRGGQVGAAVTGGVITLVLLGVTLFYVRRLSGRG
ncbi:hypothetical protein [Aeropyrum camini]|uniref:Uncharacterized protein n=1 Tax=Aeropyrum camini SY1 = JCM 12091 TaxID=1198449 RepID=U3TE17_9CREN|nr:hypothetical protein [Aeropyrum camini]BAN90280.1 hypothetical protein ACAM_0811 [Aeropyrum camini SY1 = JCM 12091]